MSRISHSILALTRPINGEVQPHRFIGTDDTQAGDGVSALGVTQHYANSEDCAVDVLGAVPVETGGAVTAGGLVQSDVDGRAINKGAGVGAARALESATAAGEFVLCVLIPN